MVFHLWHLVCAGGLAFFIGIWLGIRLVYDEIKYHDSLTPCQRCEEKEKDNG